MKAIQQLYTEYSKIDIFNKVVRISRKVPELRVMFVTKYSDLPFHLSSDEHKTEFNLFENKT